VVLPQPTLTLAVETIALELGLAASASTILLTAILLTAILLTATLLGRGTAAAAVAIVVAGAGAGARSGNVADREHAYARG
jgi:hypothetical protein